MKFEKFVLTTTPFPFSIFELQRHQCSVRNKMGCLPPCLSSEQAGMSAKAVWANATQRIACQQLVNPQLTAHQQKMFNRQPSSNQLGNIKDDSKVIRRIMECCSP